MDKINQGFQNAVFLNRVSFLPSLVSQGADINLPDDHVEQRTPLVNAASLGYMSMVEYLVMAGADLNKGDNYGNTPIIKAIWHKEYDILKFLIQQKADVNIQNIYLQTPLHWTLNTGGYPEYSYGCPSNIVLTILLDANPRLDIRNGRGETVLDMVSNIHSREKKMLLLFRNKLAERKAKEKQLEAREEAAYQRLLSENLEFEIEPEGPYRIVKTRRS